MSRIPIPNTRVSGLLMRQRLVQQVQSDQLTLFRLQDQVSTGRRINLPSDDAPAALRSITLQRILERKGQLATNVERGLSFLAATDTALNDVSSLLGNIRGAALGVAGTTSTQEERNSVVAEVNRAIEQLVQTGNRTFRGRYLFAGSQTNVSPYAFDGASVRYNGNDKEIQNFADVDVLFSSNAPGQQVFGGTSSQVLGGVDLNPHLSSETLVASLRGGRGISPNGAVAVSDGTSSVVVDLSGAVTVGDVARILEANAPPGRSLAVSIGAHGLVLDLDDAGGGNLTINEVGSGRTARELGILETTGVLTAPLTGGDLDPRITKTTRLEDLLGSKARARLESAGSNNDLLIEASVNGTQFNGAAIQVVDDNLLRAAPGVAAGAEFAEFDPDPRAARASLRFTGSGNDLIVSATAAGDAYNDVKMFVVGGIGIGNSPTAVYDPALKRLTITVDDAGATEIGEVVSAIDGTGFFTAAHDSSLEGTYNAAALVEVADIANVSGDTGSSGGNAGTLYVHIAAGQTTANHALAAINAEGTFRASLDAADTQVVAQAGIGPMSTGALGVTAGGSGGAFDNGSGLRVINGGESFELDFARAETVEDLLNGLNGSEAGLQAEINADGTGINVRSRLSGGDFQIGENGGTTAEQLGIRTLTGQTKLGAMNYGVGIPDRAGDDFQVVVDDGAGGTIELAIDVAGASTIGDVLERVNGHPLNAGLVEARLTSVGNGIEIADLNGRPLTLRNVPGSQAAEYLGLLEPAQTEVTATDGTLTGTDRNSLETESVFTSLIRLRDALATGDIVAMERAIALIDDDLERSTFARAEVGARQQGLEISRQNLQDEDVLLQTALSEELDVDLVEAISQLVAQQSALQASLQTTANILQLSLLDFI